MIRLIEKTDWIQEVKKRIFVMEFNLVSSEKQMSLLIHLLLSYLAFLPSVSILFIWEPFLPEEVNLFFKVFLFTQLPDVFSFDPAYIMYALVAFLTLCMFFIFLSISSKPFPLFTVLLRFFFAFFIFFVVPFTNYLLTIIESFIEGMQASNVQIALKLLIAVEIIVLLLFTPLYLFLKINPFRKNNIACNYNNNIAFYGYLLDISRAFILTLDSPLAVFPIISLVLECYKREIKGGYMNEGIQQIHNNTSNLIIATHLAVIFVALVGERLIGFCLYSLLLLGCFAIGILRYLNRKYEKQLPRCGSCVEKFYDFYYQLVEDMKKVNISGDEDNLYPYYFQHALECRESRCRVKVQMKKKDKISMDDITNLIGKKISTFQNCTPTNEVVLDVWNYQQGKKNAIKKRVREYSLQDEFVIEYIFHLLSYDNYESQTQQEDQEHSSKDILQKEIYQALTGYGRIYEELIKTNPHFEVIIQNMLKIRKNTVNAKDIFNQLLKTQELNYNVISIYFIFCNYFFGKDYISPQVLTKLKTIQLKNSNQDIHDSPIPTILFNRESSNIEDLNTQALRYMRARKAEIKRNTLFEFFAPPLNLEHLITYINRSEEEGKLLFFKKLNKERQQCFGRIEIETMELNSIQYAVMRIYKKNTSRNQLELLVNDKFKLIAANYNEIRYSHRGKFCLFKVEDAFQKYIYDNKEALEKMKFTKIQIIPDEIDGYLIEKDSILTNHKIISLKIAFRSIKERVKPRTSYTLSQLSEYNKKPNYSATDFVFKYDGDNDITLLGKLVPSKKRFQEESQNKKNQNYEQNQVKNTFEHGMGLRRSIYGRGIKSYRLFESQLYNIDLEDRQKYNDLFGSQDERENEINKKGFRIHQYCYISVTIVISLALFLVSLLLSIRIDEQKVQIADLFETTQELNLFTLELNRIIGIMRDAENSLYNSYSKDYLSDIEDSYNSIQERSGKILFDSSIIGMNYDNSTYDGTLNELAEVILSQIHEFIQTNDFKTVTFIHDSVINSLISEINQNDNQIQSQISNHIRKLQLQKDIYLFCILGGNIIFYLSLIGLAFKVQAMVKDTLLQILLLSDSESKSHLEVAQKIKSSLLELKKSTDVNVESLSSSRASFPNRIKPKQSKLDKKTLVCFGMLILFLFVLNLMILLIYKLEVSATLNELNTMLTQGVSLMSIYLKTSETAITLDFSESFSSKQLNSLLSQIDDSLSLIQNERRQLRFSKSFTDFINVFLFEDSCSELLSKGFISAKSQCDSTCQGFNIEAPFRIGISSYFRYIKYSLITDLRETYAATGIFSEPFRNVFNYFSNQIEEQGRQYIQKSFSFISLLNGVLFVLSFLNFSISAVILLNLKQTISTVKQLVFSLNFSKRCNQDTEKEFFNHNEEGIEQKEVDQENKLLNSANSQLEDIDD